jgi:hypothetical protein
MRFRFTYVGNFVRGVFDGRGEVKFIVSKAKGRQNRAIGTGIFAAGEMASGEIVYPAGTPKGYKCYRGPTIGVSPPLPHGKGSMEFEYGSDYVGDFFQGQITGHGVETSAEGVYDGEWKMGKKEGLGSMLFQPSFTYKVRSGMTQVRIVFALQ